MLKSAYRWHVNLDLFKYEFCPSPQEPNSPHWGQHSPTENAEHRRSTPRFHSLEDTEPQGH